MTDWGSILRSVREEQGISQRQLAVLGYEFDICLKTKPLPGLKD